APRAQGFAVLLRLYNIHLALTQNGVRAEQGPDRLDAFEPLRLLRIAVMSAWGPWLGILRLSGNIGSYHHARTSDPGGGLQMMIGTLPGRGAEVDLRVATFNMQGSSETTNSKFRLHVLPLARMHHVVALQEAGVAPFSSRHVARLQIPDQFGALHEVNHYLWEAGSSGRPETYQIYLLEVQRLRVRLAMVVSAQVDVRSVVVIADGITTPSGAIPPRPVLGLRLRLGGLDEEVTVLNFHAISNGGSNCPRVLREVSWHSASRYVLVGDFNRDPRAPGPSDSQGGNWISPPGIAELVLAQAPTYPSQGPSSMLDYALANGTSRPADAGRVGQVADSDHLPVSFTFHFCN
ncbi:MAG TPA: endonuclease/exonuclease/phosphatase family protein, partial [Pseudomonas sp.]|uniref:endonuclease/exonuclease/phosphatase family protein n=1 Tax=Pseudomonas sp. TaxID=306 RepID=UPI002B4A52E7